MATDKYVLDVDGQPVAEPDLMKWAAWMETANRHVAKDALPGNIRVSTVFLGLDHSWEGPPPIIYETMIFGGEHDGYQERYSTRDEALAGHKRALELAELGVAASPEANAK